MNKKHKVRWIAATTVLLLVLAGMAIHRHQRPAPAGDERPRTVQVAAPAHRDVPVHVDAIGTVTPTHTVTVRAQTGGTLTSLRFREGQVVHQGDVLATIDDRSLRAQALSAEGALQRDQAMLGNARSDLARVRAQLEIGSATQQQVDALSATVQQYVGTIKADQGQLENLKVQLGYAQVIAPIDGITGLRVVDVGNLIEPADSGGIVTLTTMAPIDVKFAVSEADLAAVLAAMRHGDVAVDVYDRGGRDLLASGLLDSIDNRVDATTGTVMSRASFPNGDRALFPNQFVNVRLRVKVLPNAMLVPTRAIQHGASGDYVYVVAGDKAAIRYIDAGPADGEDTVVLPADQARRTVALASADRVVVSGAENLSAGMSVTIATAPSGR